MFSDARHSCLARLQMAGRHGRCQRTWQQAITDVSERVYSRRFGPKDGGGLAPTAGVGGGTGVRRIVRVVGGSDGPAERMSAVGDGRGARAGCTRGE